MAVSSRLKYSVCITCFNEAKTIEKSLRSLMRFLDSNFEVVIVDNYSNDGTFEILRELAKVFGLKVIQRKCNRGIGREIAFEYSRGDYIIANLDMDDTFQDSLRGLLNTYHAVCDGKILLAIADTKVWSQNITIGPREIISELGGWRDLQWGEDWDLWCRAAKKNLYAWTIFRIVEAVNPHFERKKLLRKFAIRVSIYRDLMRLGRKVFSKGEHISLSQRLAFVFARSASLFYKSYGDSFSAEFDPYSNSYLIQKGKPSDEIVNPVTRETF